MMIFPKAGPGIGFSKLAINLGLASVNYNLDNEDEVNVR